jgi:hypothetical protein
MADDKKPLEALNPIFNDNPSAPPTAVSTEKSDDKGNSLSALNPLFDEPYGQVSSSAPLRQSSVTVMSPITGKEITIDPVDVAAVSGISGALLGRPIQKIAEPVAKAATAASEVLPEVGANKPYTNQWGAKTGYGIGEGSTRQQSEAYQRQFRDIGKGKTQIKGGRLWNVDEIMAEIARKEALAAEEAARLAEQKGLWGKTARTSEMLGKTLGAVGKAIPRTMTGLGLAGAGYEGADAYNRLRSGDYPGAVISGMGALGTLAATALPPTNPYFAVAKGIGAGLGAAAPLVLLPAYDYLSDKLR